jgi:hypothetical protein
MDLLAISGLWIGISLVAMGFAKAADFLRTR